MSKIVIKKDFKNGDKLYDVDLNNNFMVIEAGVNANEENLEEIIEEAEARLTAVFEDEASTMEAAVAADNLATKNAIIADNDATEQAIKADNDATEAAIIADNDATAAEIAADNAATVEAVRNLVVEEGWDWGGATTERVRFFKGDTSAVSGQSVINGQLLFDEESGIISLDDNNTRKMLGGALWDETPKKPVKYKRKTTAQIEQLPIEDGSVIYNTENGKQYMDIGNQRIPTGGAGGEVILEDETVTDDTKLILEDEDLDFQGLEISDEYTTGDNVAYSANYINKTFGGTVLWTNTNPTSGFSSQNITLSSSDYDCYEIIYEGYINNLSNFNTGKIPKGKGTSLNAMGSDNSQGPYVYHRQVDYSSDTQLSVGDCKQSYGSSSVVNNNLNIPIYVIGYKTGLFS